MPGVFYTRPAPRRRALPVNPRTGSSQPDPRPDGQTSLASVPTPDGSTNWRMDRMAQVRRFHHVGITVADLDTVTAFFVGLGSRSKARGCSWRAGSWTGHRDSRLP